MRKYLVFVGSDFSDHSSGYLEAQDDISEFDEAWYIDNYKKFILQRPWGTILKLEIDPDTKSQALTTLFTHYSPIKKKLVIDPRKKKTKKAATPKSPMDIALEQLNIWQPNPTTQA